MRPPNRWRPYARRASTSTGHATLANGSVGYDEADAHWADAAWWDEQARAMWDEADDIPDNGLYWTSVED